LREVHADDQQTLSKALLDCLATGDHQVAEFRLGDSRGVWHFLEAHAAALKNREGQVSSILLVSRDVTSRKHEERERQLMEVRVRQAQKLESIGQLAAGIAHEINTPTQYIGDNIRFLNDSFEEISQVLARYAEVEKEARSGSVSRQLLEQLDEAVEKADLPYLLEETPRAIQQSLEGVERVAKIVRAMKEFSHPGMSEKVPTNLNQAIESTVTVARNEWKYVADLVTDLDPHLPLVPCLPGEFSQVILNLVVNAAHAIADVLNDGSKGKGEITIQTRALEREVEIRVSDTGTGIPESIRNRVFDPFFTTKAVGKGTGQGLAIAHSVIKEKHHGSISFETVSGKGTAFIIRLPLSDSCRPCPPAAT
jgi:signal transduction histidine kinase